MTPFTYILIGVAAAASLPRIQAGWNPQQPPLFTLANLCSVRGFSESRVCFTTDVDVSKPKPGSHFDGFLSPDGKQFGIYNDGQDALLLLEYFTIKVKFLDWSKEQGYCAFGSIETNSGQMIDSTTFCDRSTYWLHVPRLPS